MRGGVDLARERAWPRAPRPCLRARRVAMRDDVRDRQRRRSRAARTTRPASSVMGRPIFGQETRPFASPRGAPALRRACRARPRRRREVARQLRRDVDASEALLLEQARQERCPAPPTSSMRASARRRVAQRLLLLDGQRIEGGVRHHHAAGQKADAQRREVARLRRPLVGQRRRGDGDEAVDALFS